MARKPQGLRITTTESDLPEGAGLASVFERLQAGERVEDDEFDRIYPEWAACLSKIHWTPLVVARRALSLLETRGDILDVGSGVGKFCLAGAAIVADAPTKFFGIEHRPHFVSLSRQLAWRYGLAPRISFALGSIEDLDWSRFGGIYIYNSFQEYKTPWQRIDSWVDPMRSEYARFVAITEEQLSRMPCGARLVTYHGFGGEIPEGYRLVTREHCHRGPLECWEKWR